MAVPPAPDPLPYLPPAPPARAARARWKTVLMWTLGGLVGLYFTLGFVAKLYLMANANRVREPSPAAAAAAAKAGLTKSYRTKNRLAVAHYPADFTAESLDEGTLVVKRDLPDGNGEFVEIAAIPDPAEQDLSAFAHLLVGSSRKNAEATGTWTEAAPHFLDCLPDEKGLAVDATFVTSTKVRHVVHTCTFFSPMKNRGYYLVTTVPEAHQASDQRVLEAIRDATEIL